MAGAPFKVFDFELTPDETSDADVIISRVVSQVKPEWTKDEIKFKVLSGGLVNKMMCFHVMQDENLQDAIVVRTFKASPAPVWFLDRSMEIMTIQLAALAGVSTPILATFQNGVVYKFAPGRTLVGSDLHNPRIIRAVTHAIAQLHSVDLTTPVWDMKGKQATVAEGKPYFSRYGPVFENIPKSLPTEEDSEWYQTEMKGAQHWHEEFAALRTLADEIKLPVGLAHLDLQISNIVYDEDEDRVYLIDFEYACIGPCALDFYGTMGMKWLRDYFDFFRRNDGEPEMAKHTIDLWYLEYLKKRYEIQGQDPNKVSGHDLKKLQLEANLASLWVLLHWIIFGCLMLEHRPEFLQVKAFFTTIVSKYEEQKARLPEIKDQYLQIVGSGT